jgi:hypothetical protein
MTNDTERTRVEQWVLETVDEETEPVADGEQDAEGNVWTSAPHLRQNTEKFSTVVSSWDDVEDAIDSLMADGELIYWHGLLAPTDPEHLKAAIENERQAKWPRQLLTGNLNERLQGVQAVAE